MTPDDTHCLKCGERIAPWEQLCPACNAVEQESNYHKVTDFLEEKKVTPSEISDYCAPECGEMAVPMLRTPPERLSEVGQLLQEANITLQDIACWDAEVVERNGTLEDAREKERRQDRIEYFENFENTSPSLDEPGGADRRC